MAAYKFAVAEQAYSALLVAAKRAITKSTRAEIRTADLFGVGFRD
jgi:hypothetical protein